MNHILGGHDDGEIPPSVFYSDVNIRQAIKKTLKEGTVTRKTKKKVLIKLTFTTAIGQSYYGTCYHIVVIVNLKARLVITAFPACSRN